MAQKQELFTLLADDLYLSFMDEAIHECISRIFMVRTQLYV